jgi:hypothetical protein
MKVENTFIQNIIEEYIEYYKIWDNGTSIEDTIDILEYLLDKHYDKDNDIYIKCINDLGRDYITNIYYNTDIYNTDPPDNDGDLIEYLIRYIIQTEYNEYYI